MKNDKQLVSIIMPVYNSVNYVKESVDSILLQSYSNWELIIVDDCSSDGTFGYLLSVYSENNKVKILKNKFNSGAGITRNLGLNHAQASLIAFLDADDLWSPDKLSTQVDFMKKNCSAIVHTGYSFINENGRKIPGRVCVSNIVNLRTYMRNTEIGMSTALINKDIVGEFKFHAMRTRQDTRLWLGLLSNGFVANGLNSDLVFYRVRKGQISGNKIVVAWRTFNLYMSIKNISIFERLTNFLLYAFNGVVKRIKI